MPNLCCCLLLETEYSRQGRKAALTELQTGCLHSTIRNSRNGDNYLHRHQSTFHVRATGFTKCIVGKVGYYKKLLIVLSSGQPLVLSSKYPFRRLFCFSLKCTLVFMQYYSQGLSMIPTCNRILASFFSHVLPISSYKQNC